VRFEQDHNQTHYKTRERRGVRLLEERVESFTVETLSAVWMLVKSLSTTLMTALSAGTKLADC
jgi:hypothetical protein